MLAALVFWLGGWTFPLGLGGTGLSPLTYVMAGAIWLLAFGTGVYHDLFGDGFD